MSRVGGGRVEEEEANDDDEDAKDRQSRGAEAQAVAADVQHDASRTVPEKAGLAALLNRLRCIPR